jgi:hypothetical protein
VIKVNIEVQINDVMIQVEKELGGYFDDIHAVEKAQAILLDSYHKTKRALESQK